MTTNGSFRGVKVWREAMTLVEEASKASARFPADERFGLTAQLRRAAVSVPSNIGEGKRRKHERAYLHHLDIALRSRGEVEVQLELALRLGVLPEPQYRKIQSRVEAVGKMLNALIEALQPDQPSQAARYRP